jgi:hypothetical protein
MLLLLSKGISVARELSALLGDPFTPKKVSAFVSPSTAPTGAFGDHHDTPPEPGFAPREAHKQETARSENTSGGS